MNEEFIKQQKNKLLEEKKKLEEELAFVANKDKSGDYEAKFQDLGSDQDANALEVEQFEQGLAVEHDLDNLLKRVNAALERISSGEYGKCSMGDEIEEERLRVVPWAETCIKHSK